MLKLLTVGCIIAFAMVSAQALAKTTPAQHPHAAAACLAAAAWGEARNRSQTEKVGVMSAVVTRMKRPEYADTVCGVVLQRGQFQMSSRYRAAVRRAKNTGVMKLSNLEPKDAEALISMKRLAYAVLAGKHRDPTHGATHFYSPLLRVKLGLPRRPSWAKKLPHKLSTSGFEFHGPAKARKPVVKRTLKRAKPATKLLLTLTKRTLKHAKHTMKVAIKDKRK